MISHILIRDFAIIESIDIGVREGLSIITGETGSGKSIIIEAISMALGERADTSMVRHGSDKALIQLMLYGGGGGAENSCPELVSREISREGRGICRVDGEMVTLAQLRKATEHVADIHGQYDHQRLLDPACHIDVIDSFRSDYIAAAKERVLGAWEKYYSARRALDALLEGEARSLREIDMLRFEASDIDIAAPRPGEYEDLVSDLRVMQNSERIFETLSAAYKYLTEGFSSGGASASEGIASALGALKGVSDISDDYKEMGETAAELVYGVDELSRSLRDKLDSLDFSEQAINDAIARVDVLDRLRSKYGSTIDDVLEYREEIRRRLDNIENAGDVKASLESELESAGSALALASLELSRFRRKAAEELETKVISHLHELNFSDAAFKVAFEKEGGGDGVGEAGEINPEDFTPNGIDRLEFLLSANKGQPPMPVSKVASGGEMSRIMLALKSVIGEFDDIPTMIFDEIDAGISGVTASVVGEKLRRMARSRQIICITHLPQIAAFADQHYVIEKTSDELQTYTTVRELSMDGRVMEVARLIGGRDVTDTTKESARELIAASMKR